MRTKAFALVAALAALTPLVGCGGSSSLPPGVTNVITRGGDAGFSNDSLLLASRTSESPWIPIDLAVAIEADLKRIREAYPALVGVHARPFTEPKTLLITLKPDALAQSTWRTGTLFSGDAALNKFLSDYNANKVALLTGDTFVVTFDQWLNTTRLAEVAKTVSAGIKSVDENGIAGDGDQIKRQSVGEERTFVFIKGWGDCPAGCTSRHTWTVSLAADNTISVSQSGAPLP